jgi:hypothetical protein
MRDKGSEWKTMRNFMRTGRLPFVPLVEAVCEPFLPNRGAPTANPLAVLRDLGERVGPLRDFGPVWIDLGHLTRVFSAQDVAALLNVVRFAAGLPSPNLVPVIRTSSPTEVINAAFSWARSAGCGVCLRVDGITHLDEKARVIRRLIVSSGLPNSQIDLIVDAQDLPRVASHEALCTAFPAGQTARNWVILAGTFPASITSMKPEDYEHFRERHEWQVWRNEALNGGPFRQPTYGDYATQPAIYNPSPGFPGSPSVRYTTSDDFVVLRGRAGHGSIGTDYSQYVGHARYLREQPYFCDVVTTPGDSYVQRIASQAGGTGNLTTWRVASLERHLCVTAEQVARISTVPATAVFPVAAVGVDRR